jgi:dTDP-4-amino-4,6-dideoxygalactose transaminase
MDMTLARAPPLFARNPSVNPEIASATSVRHVRHEATHGTSKEQYMNERIARPAVLGGPTTWEPSGTFAFDRWGGTAPSWDVDANALNGNAIAWPQRTAADVEGLAAVAAGAWAHNGPRDLALRAALAERRGVKHVITVNNGSEAIKVAANAVLHQRALEGKRVPVRPKVVTSALSFNATWIKSAEIGLTPVFVDVERDTLVPYVATLAAAADEDTVAFLVPAMYASIVDLPALRREADRLGIAIIVDGAHAPFGGWANASFAFWADIVTSSFQYGKVFTGGEGGDVYTDDDVLAALADRLRNVGSAGIDAEALRDVSVMGQNHRLAEPQASLLLSQLRIYDAQQAHRQAQYDRFVTGLAGSGLPFEALRRTGDEILYKVGLYNGTAVPTEKLREALRIQLTGEVNAPYPAACEPESGWLPATQPWAYAHLGIDTDTHYPMAEQAAANLLMVSHDYLLRQDAADQLLEALKVVAESESELVAWARA